MEITINTIVKPNTWLCIHKQLACNPIDQKRGVWENKGKVSGIGRVVSIMEREGNKYVVFQVQHGYGPHSYYFGASKCIPMSEFEKQGSVMFNHSYKHDWYVWMRPLDEVKPVAPSRAA